MVHSKEKNKSIDIVPEKNPDGIPIQVKSLKQLLKHAQRTKER